MVVQVGWQTTLRGRGNTATNKTTGNLKPSPQQQGGEKTHDIRSGLLVLEGLELHLFAHDDRIGIGLWRGEMIAQAQARARR